MGILKREKGTLFVPLLMASACSFQNTEQGSGTPTRTPIDHDPLLQGSCPCASGQSVEVAVGQTIFQVTASDSPFGTSPEKQHKQQ